LSKEENSKTLGIMSENENASILNRMKESVADTFDNIKEGLSKSMGSLGVDKDHMEASRDLIDRSEDRDHNSDLGREALEKYHEMEYVATEKAAELGFVAAEAESYIIHGAFDHDTYAADEATFDRDMPVHEKFEPAREDIEPVREKDKEVVNESRGSFLNDNEQWERELQRFDNEEKSGDSDHHHNANDNWAAKVGIIDKCDV
jgi:hypothetical protein